MVLEKENLKFKPVKLHLKIEPVSHPARAAWDEHTHTHTHTYICMYVCMCVSPKKIIRMLVLPLQHFKDGLLGTLTILAL